MILLHYVDQNASFQLIKGFKIVKFEQNIK